MALPLSDAEHSSCGSGILLSGCLQNRRMAAEAITKVVLLLGVYGMKTRAALPT